MGNSKSDMRVGYFDSPGSGLPGFNQNISFGASFTPKAILVFTTNTVTSASIDSEMTIGYGMSDGTTTRCLLASSKDNLFNSEAGRWQSDHLCGRLDYQFVDVVESFSLFFF